MKKIITAFLLLVSLSTFAEEIKLKVGESVKINADIIKCEAGTPGQSKLHVIADLDWDALMGLLRPGLYSCQIDWIGSTTYFTTNNYYRRIIGSGWGYEVEKFVRDQIRRGACDP